MSEAAITHRTGDWFETFTGLSFWPTDPMPQEVRLEDIAHALSLLCRFGGHTRHHYSVAQHSLLCAQIAEELGYSTRLVALCLLHDASEAYVGDMIRSLKRSLIDYEAIELKVQDAIWQALGIDPPTPEEWEAIGVVDNIAVSIEGSQLLHHGDRSRASWDHPLPIVTYAKTFGDRFIIRREEEEAVERRFFDEARRLLSAIQH